MKMLVLSPQPFFSPRGTPFSVYYRALVSAELGASIDILTYGTGQDVDVPGVRIIRIPRIRAFEPIPVGPSLRKALLDVLMIVWTVALLIRNRYDVVHAHEESVFWARLLKPVFGFKLVYDMHSRLPRQLTTFAFTRFRPLIRIFDVLENASLERADGVITISPDLARYALEIMPDRRRHFLIENSLFEPVRLLNPNGDGSDASLSRADLEGRRVILYAGTFEAYQGLDLLIPAFARVHASHPAATLVLAGGKPDQVAAYREMAEREGVGAHCHFTGTVPKAVVEALMSQAEVLVSPRLAGTSTPLKIYEQIASGHPLVATHIPAHTDVLDADVCRLVPPTVDGIAAGLAAVLSDPDLGRALATRAQRLYADKYSRASYKEKMRQLFDALA